jgi:enamine deaminase RidA (YjgF/YER057c/UK114 family)
MSRLIHILPPDRNPAYDAFNIAPATLSGNLLLTSGLIGLLPDGSMAETLSEQTELIFAQLGSILREVGGDFKDVAAVDSFHSSGADLLEQMKAFIKVRDRYIGRPGPAWTSLAVSGFAIPGTLIEVKFAAHVGG